MTMNCEAFHVMDRSKRGEVYNALKRTKDAYYDGNKDK